MEKVTIIKTDYNEIEDLLDQHYGITHYEVVAAEELGNGSNLDYDIDGKLDKWELEDFEEIQNGKFLLHRTRILINKLCADGYIEAGNYIINVSW